MNELSKYDKLLSLTFSLAPYEGIDLKQYSNPECLRDKEFALTNEEWGTAKLQGSSENAYYHYKFKNNVSIIVQSSFNPETNKSHHGFCVQQDRRIASTESIDIKHIKEVCFSMSEEAMKYNIASINLDYKFVVKYDFEEAEKKLKNKASAILQDDKLVTCIYRMFFAENNSDEIDVLVSSGAGLFHNIENMKNADREMLIARQNIPGLSMSSKLSRNIAKSTTIEEAIKQKNDFIINIDNMFNTLKNKTELIYKSILA